MRSRSSFWLIVISWHRVWIVTQSRLFFFFHSLSDTLDISSSYSELSSPPHFEGTGNGCCHHTFHVSFLVLGDFFFFVLFCFLFSNCKNWRPKMRSWRRRIGPLRGSFPNWRPTPLWHPLLLLPLLTPPPLITRPILRIRLLRRTSAANRYTERSQFTHESNPKSKENGTQISSAPLLQPSRMVISLPSSPLFYFIFFNYAPKHRDNLWRK